MAANFFILFLLTLALALVPASTQGGAEAAAPDDDDLKLRQEYMAEVVQFGTRPELAATADAKTTHRLAMFPKQEMGPTEAIFHAISRMPDNRVKDDAAMELLDAKFRVLLPHGRADDDIGFAVGKLPENTAAEARAKEEARAAAKEMMFSHLGPLFPGGSPVKFGDDL